MKKKVKEKDKENPLLAAPLRGYRTFLLPDRPSQPLRSLNQGSWNKGLNKAACWQKVHESPSSSCRCGLYAFHYLQSALNLQKSDTNPSCVALIAAKGNIEMHEHGFRAEEAEIIALIDEKLRIDPILGAHYYADKKSLKIRQVAREYKVPVLDKAEVEDYLPEVKTFAGRKSIMEYLDFRETRNQEEKGISFGAVFSLTLAFFLSMILISLDAFKPLPLFSGLLLISLLGILPLIINPDLPPTKKAQAKISFRYGFFFMSSSIYFVMLLASLFYGALQFIGLF